MDQIQVVKLAGKSFLPTEHLSDPRNFMSSLISTWNEKFLAGRLSQHSGSSENGSECLGTRRMGCTVGELTDDTAWRRDRAVPSVKKECAQQFLGLLEV